jgi:hypothetical protein
LFFPAFCSHPKQIKERFSKIAITTSANLQPILFATVSQQLFYPKTGRQIFD